MPPGGVPTTVAVFVTVPVSRSGWVIVWIAEQVVDSPGASVATGQDIPVVFGSETTIEPIVTLPMLVTRNVYGIVSPRIGSCVAVDALTTESSDSGPR